MDIAALRKALAPRDIGQEMHGLIAHLYPLCRSITGDGLRATLRRIADDIPLALHEVPTGTAVFDWTVPKEWNIADAYVQRPGGERVIDFKASNLHVVNYSAPVRRTMALRDLKEHLFTLPGYPDWVPYRTSYYKESWGFCLSHRRLAELWGEGANGDDLYEVCIESSLTDGSLTYGECYLRGESADEVLISCHACHPSLCNDNLSGVALAACLAKYLAPLRLRYSYRFLFIPATIGAISWLSLHRADIARIRHGLVLTGVGDAGGQTYKRSRRGDAEVDRAVAHALQQSGEEYDLVDFSPYGYDERQYCSPGFNLPVGCLMRTPHGRYPEYHTSADNLDFVLPASLAGSFATCLSVFDILEHNEAYVNQNPWCEPQLGRRGLYRAMGGQKGGGVDELAMLWVLNLSDGAHSLLDIADRSGLPFDMIKGAANVLRAHDLLATGAAIG